MILRKEVITRLFLSALRNGGRRTSLARIEWNVAPTCHNPKTVLFYGRPDGKVWTYVKGKTSMLQVDMTLKCRTCEDCLRKKAASWRLRALEEYRASSRTWLVTLTFSPANHQRCLDRARRHLDAQGIDFDRMPASEQFDLRHRECGREITLFLKRLRKGSKDHAPTSFRYLMVAEAHKSGLPHYHLLIHELQSAQPVRHAAIVHFWTQGFCHAKLVADARGATYALKYLTKSVMARVRASLSYGQTGVRTALAQASENESEKTASQKTPSFIEP